MTNDYKQTKKKTHKPTTEHTGSMQLKQLWLTHTTKKFSDMVYHIFLYFAQKIPRCCLLRYIVFHKNVAIFIL